MENDQFHRSLDRVDAAIARIEAALPHSAPSVSAERLATLEARHARLRDGATEALARLDRLIGEHR